MGWVIGKRDKIQAYIAIIPVFGQASFMPPDGEILRRVQFGDKSLEALFAVQRSEAV